MIHVEKNCVNEMFYAPDLEDLLFINSEAEDKLAHFQEEDVYEIEFNQELKEQQKNKQAGAELSQAQP